MRLDGGPVCTCIFLHLVVPEVAAAESAILQATIGSSFKGGCTPARGGVLGGEGALLALVLTWRTESAPRAGPRPTRPGGPSML